MKKLLLIAIFIAIGFSGCGSSSSKHEKSISSRDNILIYHNYPSNACKVLKNYYSNRSNTTVSIESDSITCESYGRVDRGYSGNCVEGDTGYSYDTSCVVGFDNRSNSNQKMIDFVEKMEVLN